MIVVLSPAVEAAPTTFTRASTMNSTKIVGIASTAPIELKSAYGYQLTLKRLTAAIEAAGMTIFARIDHQAAASGVGLNMLPATVLVYGNPIAGTPLMQAAPLIALDLPLRVLVREDASAAIYVSFHTGISITNSAGLEPGYAANLIKAEKLIANAIKLQLE